MTEPPAPGQHGTHRRLDTPGPLGVNDHGDPSHERRRGATPGSLGDDDHGTPLAGRLRLVLDPNDDETERRIATIVAAANAAPHAEDLAARLQRCLAAVRNSSSGETDGRDEKSHYVEAYFLGRLLAREGAADLPRNNADWSAAIAEDRLRTPAVEPRRMGDFFRPPGLASLKGSEAAPRLSYHRIAQSAANRLPRSGDDAAYWFEKGRADGLRDRSAQDRHLQTYNTLR